MPATLSTAYLRSNSKKHRRPRRFSPLALFATPTSPHDGTSGKVCACSRDRTALLLQPPARCDRHPRATCGFSRSTPSLSGTAFARQNPGVACRVATQLYPRRTSRRLPCRVATPVRADNQDRSAASTHGRRHRSRRSGAARVSQRGTSGKAACQTRCIPVHWREPTHRLSYEPTSARPHLAESEHLIPRLIVLIHERGSHEARLRGSAEPKIEQRYARVVANGLDDP